MTTYWGMELHPFFDLDTKWELSGQLRAPAALPPGKELPVSIV
jgi:hypothetical protein